MADVIIAAKAFDLAKGNDGFDSRCDLSKNDIINMADIVRIAVKFGYSY